MRQPMRAVPRGPAEQMAERKRGSRVKRRLRAELGEDIFASWFGRLELDTPGRWLRLCRRADAFSKELDRVPLHRSHAGALPHGSRRPRARHDRRRSAGGRDPVAIRRMSGRDIEPERSTAGPRRCETLSRPPDVHDGSADWAGAAWIRGSLRQFHLSAGRTPWRTPQPIASPITRTVRRYTTRSIFTPASDSARRTAARHRA